jgi:hypothetical protein
MNGSICFSCPFCGKAFKLPHTSAGCKAKCKCGNLIRIPKSDFSHASRAQIVGQVGQSPVAQTDPLHRTKSPRGRRSINELLSADVSALPVLRSITTFIASERTPTYSLILLFLVVFGVMEYRWVSYDINSGGKHLEPSDGLFQCQVCGKPATWAFNRTSVVGQKVVTPRHVVVYTQDIGDAHFCGLHWYFQGDVIIRILINSALLFVVAIAITLLIGFLGCLLWYPMDWLLNISRFLVRPK